MSKIKKIPVHPLFPALQSLFGSAACLLALALPFFPDEKISRLKLISFETGIFALLLVALLFWAAQKGKPSLGEGWKWEWAGLAVWVLSWMVVFLLTEEKALGEAEIRRMVLAVSVFFVFRYGPWTDVWRRRFINVFALGVILISVYGLLQKTGGVSRLQVPQMDRVMGTFGNPIFFAAYLIPGVFFVLAARRAALAPWWKGFLTLGLVFVALALFWTQTRAAWIALACAGGAGLMISAKNWEMPSWGWGALLILGGVFLIATQDTWKRDQGHLLIWRDTARLGMDHPLVGTGLGTFHARFPDYAGEDLKEKWPKGEFIVNYAHNEYLQIFSEGGILALAGFFSFIGILFWRFRHKLKGQTDPFAFLIGLGAAALLIQNCFSVDFRFSITFGLFFLLAGLALSPAEGPPLSAGPSLPPHFFLSIPILVFIAFLGGSFIFKPYQAHRKFQATTGFFDERLLDPAKTIEDLEALREKFPDEGPVLERLAFAYAKEMKTPDGKINQTMAGKAVAAYEKAVQASPESVGAWNNFANVLYTLGREPEAIQKWKKVLEIQPDFIDVLLNLGKIHYVRGDLGPASGYFERVLELDPNNAEAIVYMKRMVE